MGDNPRIPSRPVHWLAVGFGSGLAPVAPGTFGSLVGVLFFLLLSSIDVVIYAAIVGLMAIVGIWICGQTATDWQTHDHSAIVWDEIVGQMLVFVAMPLNWVTLVMGFLLFRIFDILKPWPVCVADRRVGGGFGIMLDDVLAAIPAWIGLYLLNRFIPQFPMG